MEVVGHEAVRNYFNIPASGSTQNLRAEGFSDRGVREVLLPLVRAHRQENTMRTGVTVTGKARRAAVRHARRGAIRGPFRSAKAFALRHAEITLG
jgi:RNase P protein component